MELAISTEHHPEHVNAPEQPWGQVYEQQQQTQYQLFTSPWKSGVFSACVVDRLLPSHLLTIDCGRVESVKKTAGEVNCSDKIKFLDVAFTFDALCWKFLTCSIFLKPLKQPPIKLLWLLPFKAINSWKGEEKFKCNFVLASFF